MINSWGALSDQSNNTQGTPQTLDLTPQYGANGYQSMFAYQQQTNPYDALLNQGNQLSSQDARAGMANQSNLGAQSKNYMQALEQAYPSYPNSAGAGTQMADQAPQVPGTGVVGNGTQSQPA